MYACMNPKTVFVNTPARELPVEAHGALILRSPSNGARARRLAAGALLCGQPFDARGVGAERSVKSAELSFVSCPSGERTALDPGAAVTGGAGAAEPSTNALVAVP